MAELLKNEEAQGDTVIEMRPLSLSENDQAFCTYLAALDEMTRRAYGDWVGLQQ